MRLSALKGAKEGGWRRGYIYSEERARLDEQLVPLVEGAPAVRKLGAVPLPRLQVHRRPDHVEQRENHKTDVLPGLVTAAEEHLNTRGI